jgi:hypothetical protein
MGRILRLTKNSGARWGKSAESIAQSFVTNSKMKNLKSLHGNSIVHKEIAYGALGGVGYKIGNTSFSGTGSQFGCREGLTRDMQNLNRNLAGKDNILVIRNKMPIQQVTYKEMFMEGWKDFLKDFLSHIDMSEDLIDKFGIYSKSPARISFPLNHNQSRTLGTVASALILLTRNPVAFCRDRGKKGLRNHRELIQEFVNDKLDAAGGRKAGLRTTMRYARNGSNYILWHLLYYFDLMPSISKIWVGNTPNGPDTFVTFGTARIASAIEKLDKNQREDFFDLVGGEDSAVVRGFPSSVRLAIQDVATAK